MGSAEDSEDSIDGAPRPLSERVQCYVADVVDGTPQCLPASDPTLAGLVTQEIRSCGMGTDFIIAEDASQALPESCNAPIACCSALARSFERRACLDAVEDKPDGCADWKFERWGCPSPEDADAGAAIGSTALESDAGSAPEPPGGHALCCYRTCVHTVCI